MTDHSRKPKTKQTYNTWKHEFSKLLDSYQLSEEEYQELISDLEKRKSIEKGRGYDRLDDIGEE